ncbi:MULTISPECIES: hypothetical protein [Rhodovulum]|uniref:Uncharacterized protein n=1 Tax=Rhodovulum visakhapatnamense TaxID=364297 RepID=A0A4R8FZ53_9RHOB|nr:MULTISPECIES: hypothetical protein [Rhodovulum]TDX31984.1 hypothetical protein EV657_104181 [Rhodovulum visakhapatnamense]
MESLGACRNRTETAAEALVFLRPVHRQAAKTPNLFIANELAKAIREDWARRGFWI